MIRKEGYIDIGKMLEEIGVDTTSYYSICKNPNVKLIGDILFSFKYYEETYFFKTKNDISINPYNELLVEELAKDFGIPCIEYDLAILGNDRGVLSKNFKRENINYISGRDILKKKIEYYDSNLDDDLFKVSRSTRNSLDDIWDNLEIRYQFYLNKREIISHLMKQIVNIYLFDIISCQMDRHYENWEIMESDNEINIAPIYDNERVLVYIDGSQVVNLGVDTTRMYFEYLWDSIKKFQKVSSGEFTDIIKDKLWIISEENLYKVFERIEKKTGYPMPEKRKNFYLTNYQEHKNRLEQVLGIEDIKKR